MFPSRRGHPAQLLFILALALSAALLLSSSPALLAAIGQSLPFGTLFQVTAAQATPATVKYLPSSADIGLQGTIAVNVVVENVTDLYGASLDLTFDATRLQVVDADPVASGVQIAPGALISGPQSTVDLNSADNSAGTILFVTSLQEPAPPVSGNGTLATITFRAAAPCSTWSDYGGMTALSDRQGGDIPLLVEGGLYTVLAQTATPTPAVSATPTGTAATPTATVPTATATPGQGGDVQTIWLHSGWNWFSFAIGPGGPVETVLASINGQYDYVLGEAGTYAPPPADPVFNNLPSLDPGKGYFIRMKQSANLVVQGQRVPLSTPISLGAGWHWIGYLPAAAQSLPDVLASIAGYYDYLLGETGTYAPPPAPPQYNNLFQMEPGRGYLIRMKQAGTLVYGVATATPTPTVGQTVTPTVSPSATPTATPSSSPSATGTSAPSATPTATVAAPTATATPTPTPTPTATPPPAATATVTPTVPTATATATATVAPPTPTATSTLAPSPSPTSTVGMAPTATATAGPPPMPSPTTGGPPPPPPPPGG